MGNCIAPSNSKLVSTEAHGEPLLPVGEDTYKKNGRDGQKRKDRTRTRLSKSKEAEDSSSSKPAVLCKNSTGGGGIVRVKLVIRMQELAELRSNDLTKRAAMEYLLGELQAKLIDQSTAVYNPFQQNCGTAAWTSSHSGWRPSLESIPEDNTTTN